MTKPGYPAMSIKRKLLFELSPRHVVTRNNITVSQSQIDPVTTELLRNATSSNTRTTYRAAIKHFRRWGGMLPTDSQTLMSYLTDNRMKLKKKTLDVYLTALGQWHESQNLPNPCKDMAVKKLVKGIKNTHGVPEERAYALSLEQISNMISVLREETDTAKKHRNIAVLLLGYFGAFRRSELVNIKVEDIMWSNEGIEITVNRSKTDQEGKGSKRFLAYCDADLCPASALKAWLANGKIKEGYVFRSIDRWDGVSEKGMHPGQVNRLLKSLAKACGYPEALISAHSLRRGFATQSVKNGVDRHKLKSYIGWKSDETMNKYIDDAEKSMDNPVKTVLDGGK